MDGAKLTGTATQSQRGATEIKEGKVSGDQIRFQRKVGDFAEYEIVAKRAK